MFIYIYNLTWIHDDKVLHFLIGWFIFITLMLLLKNIKFSFFIVMFIAWIKEFIDYFIPSHNSELFDFLVTMIVPILIYIFIIIKKNVKYNKNFKQKKLKNNVKYWKPKNKNTIISNK